jgi:hypothetical protein
LSEGLQQKPLAISCRAGRGKRCDAFVDLDVHARLAKQIWTIGTDGYARRFSTKQERFDGAPKLIAMHREVMGLHLFRARPGDPEVDHINRNRLDNQKGNLRIVSRSLNVMNRSGSGLSKYLGVSFFKPAKLWRAYITFDGRRIELGYFKSEIDAAAARDAASFRLFGKAAPLNLVGTP